MNIILKVLVISLLVFLSINLIAQPYEGEKGDVNNDGLVNMLDMLDVANHILGIVVLDEQELWRADLNGPERNCAGDGCANVLDMVKIANIILGFETCSGLMDIDGNIYKTVTIGNQVWMAENLRVTHYRSGGYIPNVTETSSWAERSFGAYCNYDNNSNNVSTYGRLYNWFVLDSFRVIAPKGWHVPTDEEWKRLEMYLGMSKSEVDKTGWRGTDEGDKMKESGTTHWENLNTGTNESGFSALPGGSRYHYGLFGDMGYKAHFWCLTSNSDTHAWRRSLDYNSSEVRRDVADKRYGLSIRLVRD